MNRRLRFFCLAAFLFSGVAGPASAGRAVQPGPETRGLLGSLLDPRQLAAVLDILSGRGGWGTLGPQPQRPRPELPRRPAAEVTLPLPEPGQGRGEGTAEEPWVGVIGGFLARFPFDAPHLLAPSGRDEARGWPEAAALDRYLAALDYPPAVIRVPAGHYREEGLTVAPGLWLVADGPVVISAVAQGPPGDVLVDLHVGAGLVGFRLEGDARPFSPAAATRLTAVRVRHRALVADNHLRRFSGHGVLAAGNRGREGSLVTVRDNIIEETGYSGIRGQSRWEVSHNQVRHAGLLRRGNGCDGIIIAFGLESRVTNNLVIGARRPLGRHVIGGRRVHDSLYAGNIAIAEGTMRGTITLADACHQNRLTGNLAIVTGRSENDFQAGIEANGYGNHLERNAVIGSPRALRTGARWEEEPVNIISHNYAEYALSGIHGSGRAGGHYEATGNILDSLAAPLPAADPEAHGFFGAIRTPGGVPVPDVDPRISIEELP